MKRLIIQHPQLGQAQVDAFTAALGQAPVRLHQTSACWQAPIVDIAAFRELAQVNGVDVHLLPANARLADFRLIAFDMDSTLITIECIDEIADFAGRKAEVAAITEATMRGEIKNFDESLTRRVALLKGLDAAVLERVYAERLQLSPGAERLLQGVRASGLKVLLVSGGFTFFTERLRDRLALDYTRANQLEIVAGKLSGRVIGPIVNAEQKRSSLLETCALIGCDASQSIAVGDGANDLMMLRAAGMSVAYHAKEVVRAETTHALNHSGLDAILDLFAGDDI